MERVEALCDDTIGQTVEFLQVQFSGVAARSIVIVAQMITDEQAVVGLLVAFGEEGEFGVFGFFLGIRNTCAQCNEHDQCCYCAFYAHTLYKTTLVCF